MTSVTTTAPLRKASAFPAGLIAAARLLQRQLFTAADFRVSS